MKKRILSISIVLILITLLLPTLLLVPASAASEPVCQLQYDSKWNYVDYGNDTVYNSACGIFSFSNAIHYLTGNKPDIITIADWAYDAGYYTSTYGTNQSMFSAVQAKWGSTYGFTVTSTTASWSNTTLKNHLAGGGTAVMNVPGHYIALVGYDTASGKYHIYDSANSSNRGTAADGTAWLTETQINSYNSAHGLVPVSGCWLFTRTGSAPAWYPSDLTGSADLGSSFYATISNTTNGVTTYLTMNDDWDSVSGKAKDVQSLSQIWKFTRQTDGTYEIENSASYLRLDVADWATTDGAAVHLYTDTDGANQRWYVRADGDGYRLTPKHNDSVKLDLSTGTQKLQIWTSSGGPAQKFYITKVTGTLPSVDLGRDFFATISNVNNGTTVYLENMDGSIVKGQEKDSSAAQTWLFHRQGDGSYTIANVTASGSLLNVNYGSSEDGTGVELVTADGQDKQSWYIYKQGDGFKLIPKCATGSALDCPTSTQITQIWTISGGSAQRFYIDYISYDVVDNDFYATIYNVGKNVYFTANSDGSVNGQAQSSAQDQVWHFIRQADGSYEISSPFMGGKCLELANSGISDGTVVKLYDDHDGANQRWYIYKYAEGYHLIPKLARNQALDCSGSYTAQTWTFSGGTAQLFQIEKHTHTSSYTYTSNGDGTHIKKYSCCGMTINSAEDCSGGTVTCTDAKVCTNCKSSYGSTLGHSYTVLQADANNHWYKCSNCTSTSGTAAHSGGTATCTTKAVCTTCNISYGAEPSHSKTYHAAQAVSCFSVGWNAYETCSKCSYSTKGADLPAIGHHNYGADGVCTVCQSKLKISGASLNLSQDIAVRFFVKDTTLASYDYYRFVVSFNGKTYTIPGTDAEISGIKCKQFTFVNIDPSLMAEDICVTLSVSKDNTTWIKADDFHYSIADYCYSMLRTDTTAAQLKTLIVDLLNYGASMQQYFGTTTGFVNESLTAGEKLLGTQETPTVQNDLAISGDTVTLIKWRGALLNLNASITPKVYFVLNNGVNIADLTANITCNGRTWQSTAFASTTISGVDAYMLEVDGLTILDLHETITITITDGTSTSQAITYSVESYAYDKQNGTDEPLKALMISIMKYLNSTNAYFNPQQATTYTVTFASNGATSGTMAAQTYAYGETVNLPINTFEKTDYVFAGWLGSDGKTYTNAQEITKTLSDGTSLELTAIWKSGLGFDISEWQAGMSVSDLKEYDIGYLILRGGYTGYGTGDTLNKDPNFEDFYAQAKALGIPVGAYWYSCANTYEKGWNEAKYMYENCLQGKTFELPIFIDVENNEHQTTDKAGVTAAINGFCDYMYSQNMYPAVYTYMYFCQYMDMDEIAAKYDIWIAAYDVEQSWVDENFTYGSYDMWQWTEAYEGSLDANYIYRDYETLIKRFGLNGFTATESGAQFKTNIELAEEVLAGQWGNGDDRKIALTAAGYDYTSVQEAVEYLLTA